MAVSARQGGHAQLRRGRAESDDDHANDERAHAEGLRDGARAIHERVRAPRQHGEAAQHEDN